MIKIIFLIEFVVESFSSAMLKKEDKKKIGEAFSVDYTDNGGRNQHCHHKKNTQIAEKSLD